jgi:4'-phosphopantetheinyl transferase
VHAPPAPWPPLHETDARALGADELRLLWCPTQPDEAPRRQRIDALLRRVLAPLLGLEPDALRFGRETKGRPFLRHERAPDFTLCDTTGGTLVALSHGARVGVDLELGARQPPAARLANRYFDAAEAQALAALPPLQAARDFILLWTAKEASCKATGTGIFGFLPRWRFAPGEPAPRLLALPDDAGEPARWSFLRVQPSAVHTGVFAMRDAQPALRLRAFTLGAERA